MTSPTPNRDSPEVSAAEAVFDLLIAPELAELGYNATEGVIRIHDAERLTGLLDLDPADLGMDPTAFEEDGDVVGPWTLTRMLAKRAAERDPHRVLGYVEREEADARRDAIYGHSYPSRGKAKAWHVSPETVHRSTTSIASRSARSFATGPARDRSTTGMRSGHTRWSP